MALAAALAEKYDCPAETIRFVASLAHDNGKAHCRGGAVARIEADDCRVGASIVAAGLRPDSARFTDAILHACGAI